MVRYSYRSFRICVRCVIKDRILQFTNLSSGMHNNFYWMGQVGSWRGNRLFWESKISRTMPLLAIALVYRTVSVLPYLPYMFVLTDLFPYLTPVHSERKKCPFYSFCHWIPSSSSSPGTSSHQLSPLSPLSSTLLHRILFINLYALSDATLKQILMPAHLHSLTTGWHQLVSGYSVHTSPPLQAHASAFLCCQSSLCISLISHWYCTTVCMLIYLPLAFDYT